MSNLEAEGQVLNIEGGKKITLDLGDGKTRTIRIASNYEGSPPQVGMRIKAQFRQWAPDDWPAGRNPMNMLEGWEEVQDSGAVLSGNGGGHVLGSTPPRPEDSSQWAIGQAVRCVEAGIDLADSEIQKKVAEGARFLLSIRAYVAVSEEG